MRALLVGGSKSGKSGLAQSLAKALGKDGPLYYLATMEPVDGEDRARIARHLDARVGWGFATVEQARGLEQCRARISPEGTVLLDSVTALLANEMFHSGLDEQAQNRSLTEILAISSGCRHLICVCDDIVRDAGRYEAWTERYRRDLALLCRQLAEVFEVVCEVTAGLPKVWKGDLSAFVSLGREG